MKLYKPLFSIVIIFVQLILSIREYFKLQDWKKVNYNLDSLIDINTTYDSLLLFIFVIGVYEIITKPSWIKVTIRVLLICIILGTEFSHFIPINQFYYGVYNFTWFIAVVSAILILIQIVKYSIKK